MDRLISFCFLRTKSLCTLQLVESWLRPPTRWSQRGTTDILDCYNLHFIITVACKFWGVYLVCTRASRGEPIELEAGHSIECVTYASRSIVLNMFLHVDLSPFHLVFFGWTRDFGLVNFGDCSLSRFGFILRTDRRTDRHCTQADTVEDATVIVVSKYTRETNWRLHSSCTVLGLLMLSGTGYEF